MEKISFDSLTVCAVVRELQAHLTGGQIQDIRQPSATELLLGVRSAGKNYLLLLSADARFARLHLTETRKPNPPTPPAFCALLRKRLENGFIRDIQQVGFDRIVTFTIETREEREEGRDGREEIGGNREQGTGMRGREDSSTPYTRHPTPVLYTLLGEFMGKHSNVILLRDNGQIVDAMKRISHRVNRLRETLPGLPYQSPPDQSDKLDPFAPDAVAAMAQDLEGGDEDAIATQLMADYAGVSPFLAREIAVRAIRNTGNPADGLRQAWREIFGAAQIHRFAPVYIAPRKGTVPAAYPFPTVQLPNDAQEPADSLSFALDDAYKIQIETTLFTAQLNDLRGRIDREIKRLTKQKLSLARTLAESERAEEHKQNGELILANLWKIQTGNKEVTVQDYFDPELRDRTLPLDPKIAPQENAEASFKRYRKAKESVNVALSQQADVEKSLLQLIDAKRKADYWQDDPTLTVAPIQRLRAELIGSGLLRPDEAPETDAAKTSGSKPLDFQGHKIRRYFINGYEILVGESATANDFLTTRLAAPNDLWLHVRASASSHVVIRTRGQGEGIPRSVLEFAALQCALHSSQKHAALVAVDYTLKKHVRKPRGSAPGGADYQRETTLHIEPGGS